MTFNQKSWLLLFIAILFSLFFSFYQLHQTPPGFTHDEIRHALDALDALEGTYHVLSPRLKQQVMTYNYLTAGVYYLFGPSRYIQRALSAIFAPLLVLMLFITGRLLFKPYFVSSKRTLFALFASLLASSSLWVIFSARIGIEYIVTTVCATLALGTFLVGYRQQQSRYIIATALFGSLSFWIYEGSAFLLILFPLVILSDILFKKITSDRLPMSFFKVLKLLFLYSLIVTTLVLPAVIVMVSGKNPDIHYTTEQLIINNGSSVSEFVSLFGQSLTAHAKTFVTLAGDTNWVANYAGDPLLSPFLALSFVMGLIICIVRLHKLPYRLLLIYFLVMLTPPVLTFTGDSIRHFRMCGLIVPTYYLIALSWVELLEWLSQRFRAIVSIWKLGTLAILVYCLITLPLTAYQRYFIDWATHPMVTTNTKLFGQPSFQLIERMNQETHPQAIFLLTQDKFHPNRIIDYFYHGSTPFRYFYIQDKSKLNDQIQALQPYRRIYLITQLRAQRELRHGNTDAGAVIAILEKHGQFIDVETLFRWKWQDDLPYRTDQVDYQIRSYDIEPQRLLDIELN